MKASILLKISTVLIMTGLLTATPEAARAYQAEIARDKYGVPYIIAPTLADAAYGDGYAQAEDRPQLLLNNVLLATGTTAAAFGPGAISSGCPDGQNVCNDTASRLTGARRTAFDDWDSLPPEVREIATAFAAGLNQWGQDHPAELPPGARVVLPQDIVALVQFAGLGRQLQQAQKEKQSSGEDPECGEGSNGWVLSDDRTSGRGPIIQADPHTPWSGLNRWYEKAYVTPEVTVHGANMTGAPLFLYAVTDTIGWTVTRNPGDRGDCFEITPDPNDPKRYLFDGASVALDQLIETIDVAGGSAVDVTLFHSVHGPLFARNGTSAYFAASMSLFGRAGVLTQLREMLLADDLDAFEQAISRMEIDGANVLYADRAGNIHYGWLNRLHDRSDAFDWLECVPGDTSASLFTGIWPYSALPSSTNDPGGYYQASNQADWMKTGGAWGIDPAAFPSWFLTTDTGDHFGARPQRVVDLIQKKPRMSLGRARKSSVDTRIVAAEWMIPVIERAIVELGDNGDPAVQDALVELLRWVRRPHARDNARGYTLYHEWNGFWTRDAVNAATDPSPAPPRIREVYDLPDHPEQVSDLDLGRAHQAFLDAVAHLDSYFQSGAYDSPIPRWGDINFIPLADGTLFEFGGADAETQGVWQGSHGNGSCGSGPNTRPDGTWRVDSGSDFMMTAQLRDKPRVYTLVPYGQSDDPASEHFADQTPRYVKGKYKRVPFGEDEVRRKARSIQSVVGAECAGLASLTSTDRLELVNGPLPCNQDPSDTAVCGIFEATALGGAGTIGPFDDPDLDENLLDRPVLLSVRAPNAEAFCDGSRWIVFESGGPGRGYGPTFGNTEPGEYVEGGDGYGDDLIAWHNDQGSVTVDVHWRCPTPTCAPAHDGWVPGPDAGEQAQAWFADTGGTGYVGTGSRALAVHEWAFANAGQKLCAHAHSGGSGRLITTLTRYGGEDLFDTVVFDGGPVFAYIPWYCHLDDGPLGAVDPKFPINACDRATGTCAQSNAQIYDCARSSDNACLTYTSCVDGTFDQTMIEDSNFIRATDRSFDDTNLGIVFGGQDFSPAPAHARLWLSGYDNGVAQIPALSAKQIVVRQGSCPSEQGIYVTKRVTDLGPRDCTDWDPAGFPGVGQTQTGFDSRLQLSGHDTTLLEDGALAVQDVMLSLCGS